MDVRRLPCLFARAAVGERFWFGVALLHALASVAPNDCETFNAIWVWPSEGKPGERLSRRLGMDASADTLLRLVRSGAVPPCLMPRIVGIDEWAWRLRRRYETMIVAGELAESSSCRRNHCTRSCRSLRRRHSGRRSQRLSGRRSMASALQCRRSLQDGRFRSTSADPADGGRYSHARSAG